MVTAPHEIVLGAVTKHIVRWFTHFEEEEEYHNGDDTTIDLAKSYEIWGHTRVSLQNGNNWEPDQSFRIRRNGHKKDHAYPALVIEVSYSQRRKDLEHRAETWIRFSNSNVHTVIGLDLNDVYQSSENRSATLSVWKSRRGQAELVEKRQVCPFPVRYPFNDKNS